MIWEPLIFWLSLFHLLYCPAKLIGRRKRRTWLSPAWSGKIFSAVQVEIDRGEISLPGPVPFLFFAFIKTPSFSILHYILHSPWAVLWVIHMGKCKNHPQVESSYYCTKHQYHLCPLCLKCSDPQIYCKFRTSCIICFLDKEKKVKQFWGARGNRHGEAADPVPRWIAKTDRLTGIWRLRFRQV